MKLSSPLYVVWETTLDCNARCVHCYSDALFGRGPDYWPLKESLELIDQLAEAGVFILALSGGEVLLRPDWEQLIAHATSLGMRVTFATNGILVTPDVARRLQELGVSNVSVSLDGATAENHDAIRGLPGIFKKACAAIQHLAEAGVRVTVNYTPMKPNLSEAQDLIALAYRLGAEKINLTEYVYTTRGGVELMPSPQELGTLLDTWIKAGQKWKGKIDVDWHDCRVGLLLPGAEADPYKGCGAGYTHCRITVDRDVTPCVVLPVPVGNLKQQSFAEIWRSAAELHKIRSRDNINSGNCSVCEHKAKCGGCRAASYAWYGDAYAGDPTCWIKPDLPEFGSGTTRKEEAQG
ncbi:radical SAM additional 4Fe4S-binding SPASM domain-containing protein [Pseudovibrio denitrificans]|uniref:Radical SAM additional 4Fe4S-binding SPASM domain-containing protein n=1 Tax=Pseudovibrio denitrificans TaxID=258256 RepID=A0A1I7DYH1_9HYPH|nr:radical SAM protein [Pseudovibrio denitrificans]SFU16728.1 radical SAM additional 4Fe4S-binding SPASM domain-containing protein [Pseudovibrio denitrificans]